MIDGDTMQKVMNEVAGMVPVESSKLKYTDEMLEFRRKVETEWSEWLREHPDAELYIPNELPGLPGDDE